MWTTCEAIGAATAETITITGVVNYLRITNVVGAALYLKFDWAAGDTEVSATNYDVALADDVGAFVEFIHRTPTFPKFKNVRVLSAGAGSIAFIGW